MKIILTFIDNLKRIDKILLLLPLCFASVSVIMLISITKADSGIINRTVIVQGASFVLGYILICFIISIDYTDVERFEKILYVGSLLFQMSVYLPYIGVEEYGSRAWINVGITTLQPSEFVKISFIVLFSLYLNRNRKKLHDLKDFAKACIYAMPLIGIVAIEDLGAGIVMIFMFISMLFVAGIKAGLFARLAIFGVILMPIAYRFMQPHQKERFVAFLYPENVEIDATYQVWQSKVAIGSGGIWGKGLFHGTIKESNILPVQESDFIFAVICEELGMIGGLVIMLLYAILLFRMWRSVVKTTDYLGGLICIGVLSMFGFQMFENLGMTMGIMPVTGITLPFLSAGGTSVLANMMLIGLVLNVSIRNSKYKRRIVYETPTIGTSPR